MIQIQHRLGLSNKGSTVLKRGYAVLSYALITVGSAQGADDPAGEDYFDQLPVVLTVSRLAQPISDTPGAVTIIDRDKIRRSGARTVADVLRLVPGYMVAGWNGANPNAAYHVPLDEYGVRNLVLVDGRSVYSSFYLGDTHRGMMGIMLEDIERIEVLRGSNSAAYGANAMFGVINIVTRHTEDSKGGEIVLTGGDNGIEDYRARIGWGDATASFRISAGQQKDNGYKNVHDDKSLGQFHFRSDLRPTLNDDVLLEIGSVEANTGEGFRNQNGNPLRTITWQDTYLRGQWSHQVSASEAIKFSADYDEERTRDAAPFPPLPAVLLDFSGTGRRLNLEFQHQRNLAETVRAVWGAGYKYEDARSKPIYFRNDAISAHESRLFGNLEWRITSQWLVNAGLFVGNHSWTGTYTTPRLMLNYHLTPDHTLRAGVTKSERTPSLFELAGDIRYFLNGTLIGRTVAARGNAQPESLRSQEIGYFGNFRDWNLTLDVRGYHERMQELLDVSSYTLATPLPATGRSVKDYVNYPGLTAKGVEYQLRWSPVEKTEVWLNQNFEHHEWDDRSKQDRLPPSYATTLALFQKLPADLDLTVLFHTNGKLAWRGSNNETLHTRRVDVRLAYPFRLGTTKAEAAVVAQAANGDQPIFLPKDGYIFERSLFGTLRLEF